MTSLKNDRDKMAKNDSSHNAKKFENAAFILKTNTMLEKLENAEIVCNFGLVFEENSGKEIIRFLSRSHFRKAPFSNNNNSLLTLP